MNEIGRELRPVLQPIKSVKVGILGSNNIVLNGCKLLDITFSDNDQSLVNISAIEFTNRYTGTVVISGKYKVLQSPSNTDSFRLEWRKLITKRLMPKYHYVTGAESRFLIRSTEFLTDAADICALRIVLQQPSVQFSDFSIENLKVYTENASKKLPDSVAKLLTIKCGDSSNHLSQTYKDFPPSVEKVSSLLQRMWSLGKKCHDLNHTNIHIQRFDKDGCYDINLLSY